MPTLKINKYLPVVLLLVFVMCSSMQLYFTWKFPISFVNLGSALLLVPYFLKLKASKSTPLVILLVFIVFLYNYTHNTLHFSLFSLLNFIAIVVISLFVILSNNEFKVKLYRAFDLFIKIICAISLVGWALYLAGVPLPHYFSDTSDYYSHEVYYLFLVGANSWLDILPRFCGMFLEPGHVGSTAVLLLYINRFNFKNKSNFIYLLSIIFSLSLAAYMLLLIGLFAYRILNGKAVFKYIISFSIFVGLFYLFGSTYNNGNNVINYKIIKRLEIVDGKLVGDNRTSKVFDAQYDRWLRSGNILSGYGRKAYGGGADGSNLLHGTASYKRFFFINGILGLILVFTLYGLLLYKYPSRQGLGFAFVYLACNMIRDYPLRMMWLFIFILGILTFFLEKQEVLINKNDKFKIT